MNEPHYEYDSLGAFLVWLNKATEEEQQEIFDPVLKAWSKEMERFDKD